MSSSAEEKIAEQIVMDRLKEARIAAGMTQSDIAKPLGITYQHVHKMESGINRMPFIRVYRVAKMLGISMNNLFKGID
jgi:DNA-binding XRE family transcriptional regulator